MESIANFIVELMSILVHIVIDGSPDRTVFNNTSRFATQEKVVK
jgi:hypothetical protein